MAGEEEITTTDALSAAWDQHASEAEEPEVEEIVTDESYQVQPEEPAQEADDGGQPSDQSSEPNQEAVSGNQPAAEAQPEAEPSVPSAPVGLPAPAREQWASTPPAMQQAIIEREKQFAQRIQQDSEAANRARAMDQALAPYQQYFAMNGGAPEQQVNNLLQTASVLQMGTPVQKAQMVADLIGSFGVDIQSLDQILTGNQPPAGAVAEGHIQHQIQQAMAPYQQMLNQMGHQQQVNDQQVTIESQNAVAAFSQDPANEFYQDVRSDMADIIELASKRNQVMSLAEAYQRACAINPQVQEVMRSRDAAASLANKQQAAKPLVAAPSAPAPAEVSYDTVRGSIAAAWDAHEPGTQQI